METFAITKIKGKNRERVADVTAEEVPLTLIVGGKELVTLLCSPLDLEDLARGFLFTSGLVRKIGGIKEILIDEKHWVAHIELTDKSGKNLVFTRVYTSGCGRGTIFYNADDVMYKRKIISDFRIENTDVNALITDFQKKSDTYLKTGGVHSALLANEKSILVFREDIGRHNAIDKVIGGAMFEGASFRNKILATSGRISSEVLLKVRKCGIPIVISKSAPTNQAVKLSRQMGITLVCFARASRMNIYSGEERIIIKG